MRRFSMPIIGWVIIGLVLVAIMPVIAAWYQIDRNINSIVSQTLQTHQIFALSTADQLANRIDFYSERIAAVGDDPDLYLNPNSEEAKAVLVDLVGQLERAVSVSEQDESGFVTERNGRVTVSLFARREGEDVLLFSARSSGMKVAPGELVAEKMSSPPTFIQHQGDLLLRIQQETTRPRVFLQALLNSDGLREILEPRELGPNAVLMLVGEDQHVYYGDPEKFALIPENMREVLVHKGVATAGDSFRDADVPIVYGFSKVGNLPLRVVSMQPAELAETARSEMMSTATFTFGGVMLAVILLSTGAYFVVIQPIREVIGAQRRLIGGDQRTASGGGEISQLKSAFEKLEQAFVERDAVSEVFLDRYQVVRRLGTGAMGTVYLGWDPKLHRKVALKTVRFAGIHTAEERADLTERLLDEALAAAPLSHPNIVTVYDVLGDANAAFIAMEYIAGQSLEASIRKRGSIPPDRVEEIAAGVLAGLRMAHDAGIIHRDIKPANILLTEDGLPKLTDFGIAAYVHKVDEREAGVVMGTPGYIAPEAYRNGQFSPRTDLFALGVTLVECLSGEDVFSGRNTAQVISQTKGKEVALDGPYRERMSPQLVQLCERLLAKNPEERVQNVEEALAVLGRGPDMGGEEETSGKEKHAPEVDSSRTTEEIELDHSAVTSRGTRRVD